MSPARRRPRVRKQRSADSGFIVPEKFTLQKVRETDWPRGRIIVASCRSGTALAAKAVERYRQLLREGGSRTDVVFLEDIDARFSDGETNVRIGQHVSGADVYIVQSTFDPTSELSVDQNYMAFLVAARAFHEHGARHITGVLPYLAYARQDKPTKFTREPTTAKLMADLSVEAGINRLIVWDPHCYQIRGFYGKVPVNMLESLTLFRHEFRRFAGRDDVIAVAPDVGASKFVTHFSRSLNVKSAIASKFRPSPEKVEISEIIGDFRGERVALVLDDMISGGGTVFELAKKLSREKGIREIHLGASHNLCVRNAAGLLKTMRRKYGLKQVVVTNSIPQTKAFCGLKFVTVRCLSDYLARTINRIHNNRSVSEVFYRP